MSAILANKFAEMLEEAGVIAPGRANRIHRIVIDCVSGEPVMIYVQEYGDGKSLEKLAPMLKGMIPDA